MNSFIQIPREITLLISLIVIALCLIIIIAQWKLFKKAEMPGWYVLIPFYSQYKIFDICWSKQMYFVYFVFYALLNLINSGLLSGVLSIIILVLTAIYYINLSRAFGYKDIFALGLIFLPVIFFPIMAYSKNTYVGKENQLCKINL